MYKYTIFFLCATLVFAFSCKSNADTIPSLEEVKDQYTKWNSQFQKDFNRFIIYFSDKKMIDKINLNKIFSNSLEKNSLIIKSIQNMIDIREIIPDKEQLFYDDIPLYGKLLPELIAIAKPVGIGGGFTNSDGGVVVYLDIKLSKKHNPFVGNLPPAHEKLVRNHLPFAIFKHYKNKIRLWGLSKEFESVMRYSREEKMESLRRKFIPGWKGKNNDN